MRERMIPSPYRRKGGVVKQRLADNEMAQSPLYQGSRAVATGDDDDDEDDASTLNEVTWTNETSSFNIEYSGLSRGLSQQGFGRPRRLKMVDILSDVPEETEKTSSGLKGKLAKLEKSLEDIDAVKEVIPAEKTVKPQSASEGNVNLCGNDDMKSGNLMHLGENSWQDAKKEGGTKKKKQLSSPWKKSSSPSQCRKSSPDAENTRSPRWVLGKGCRPRGSQKKFPVVTGSQLVNKKPSPVISNADWENVSIVRHGENALPHRTSSSNRRIFVRESTPSLVDTQNVLETKNTCKSVSFNRNDLSRTNAAIHRKRRGVFVSPLADKGKVVCKPMEAVTKQETFANNSFEQSKGPHEQVEEGQGRPASPIRESFEGGSDRACVGKKRELQPQEKHSATTASRHGGNIALKQRPAKRKGFNGTFGCKVTRASPAKFDSDNQQYPTTIYPKQTQQQKKFWRWRQQRQRADLKSGTQQHQQMRCPSVSSNSFCGHSSATDRPLAGNRSDATLVGKRDSWIWFSHETRPNVENFVTRQRRFRSKDPRVAHLAAEIRRQDEMNKAIEQEAGSIAKAPCIVLQEVCDPALKPETMQLHATHDIANTQSNVYHAKSNQITISKNKNETRRGVILQDSREPKASMEDGCNPNILETDHHSPDIPDSDQAIISPSFTKEDKSGHEVHRSPRSNEIQRSPQSDVREVDAKVSAEDKNIPGVSPTQSGSTSSRKTAILLVTHDNEQTGFLAKPTIAHSLATQIAVASSRSLFELSPILLLHEHDPISRGCETEDMSCASTKASTSSLINLRPIRSVPSQVRTWESWISEEQQNDEGLAHRYSSGSPPKTCPNKKQCDLIRKSPSPVKLGRKQQGIRPQVTQRPPPVDQTSSSLGSGSYTAGLNAVTSNVMSPDKASYGHEKAKSPHTLSMTFTQESSDSPLKQRLSTLRQCVINKEVKDSVFKMLFDQEQSTALILDSTAKERNENNVSRRELSTKCNAVDDESIPSGNKNFASRRSPRLRSGSKIDVFHPTYYLGKRLKRRLTNSSLSKSPGKSESAACHNRPNRLPDALSCVSLSCGNRKCFFRSLSFPSLREVPGMCLEEPIDIVSGERGEWSKVKVAKERNNRSNAAEVSLHNNLLEDHSLRDGSTLDFSMSSLERFEKKVYEQEGIFDVKQPDFLESVFGLLENPSNIQQIGDEAKRVKILIEDQEIKDQMNEADSVIYCNTSDNKSVEEQSCMTKSCDAHVCKVIETPQKSEGDEKEGKKLEKHSNHLFVLTSTQNSKVPGFSTDHTDLTSRNNSEAETPNFAKNKTTQENPVDYCQLSCPLKAKKNCGVPLLAPRTSKYLKKNVRKVGSINTVEQSVFKTFTSNVSEKSSNRSTENSSKGNSLPDIKAAPSCCLDAKVNDKETLHLKRIKRWKDDGSGLPSAKRHVPVSKLISDISSISSPSSSPLQCQKSSDSGVKMVYAQPKKASIKLNGKGTERKSEISHRSHLRKANKFYGKNQMRITRAVAVVCKPPSVASTLQTVVNSPSGVGSQRLAPNIGATTKACLNFASCSDKEFSKSPINKKFSFASLKKEGDKGPSFPVADNTVFSCFYPTGVPIALHRRKSKDNSFGGSRAICKSKNIIDLRSHFDETSCNELNVSSVDNICQIDDGPGVSSAGNLNCHTSIRKNVSSVLKGDENRGEFNQQSKTESASTNNSASVGRETEFISNVNSVSKLSNKRPRYHSGGVKKGIDRIRSTTVIPVFQVGDHTAQNLLCSSHAEKHEHRVKRQVSRSPNLSTEGRRVVSILIGAGGDLYLERNWPRQAIHCRQNISSSLRRAHALAKYNKSAGVTSNDPRLSLSRDSCSKTQVKDTSTKIHLLDTTYPRAKSLIAQRPAMRRHAKSQRTHTDDHDAAKPSIKLKISKSKSCDEEAETCCSVSAQMIARDPLTLGQDRKNGVSCASHSSNHDSGFDDSLLYDLTTSFPSTYVVETEKNQTLNVKTDTERSLDHMQSKKVESEDAPTDSEREIRAQQEMSNGEFQVCKSTSVCSVQDTTSLATTDMFLSSISPLSTHAPPEACQSIDQSESSHCSRSKSEKGKIIEEFNDGEIPTDRVLRSPRALCADVFQNPMVHNRSLPEVDTLSIANSPRDVADALTYPVVESCKQQPKSESDEGPNARGLLGNAIPTVNLQAPVHKSQSSSLLPGVSSHSVDCQNVEVRTRFKQDGGFPSCGRFVESDRPLLSPRVCLLCPGSPLIPPNTHTILLNTPPRSQATPPLPCSCLYDSSPSCLCDLGLRVETSRSGSVTGDSLTDLVDEREDVATCQRQSGDLLDIEGIGQCRGNGFDTVDTEGVGPWQRNGKLLDKEDVGLGRGKNRNNTETNSKAQNHGTDSPGQKVDQATNIFEQMKSGGGNVSSVKIIHDADFYHAIVTPLPMTSSDEEEELDTTAGAISKRNLLKVYSTAAQHEDVSHSSQPFILTSHVKRNLKTQQRSSNNTPKRWDGLSKVDIEHIASPSIGHTEQSIHVLDSSSRLTNFHYKSTSVPNSCRMLSRNDHSVAPVRSVGSLEFLVERYSCPSPEEKAKFGMSEAQKRAVIKKRSVEFQDLLERF